MIDLKSTFSLFDFFRKIYLSYSDNKKRKLEILEQLIREKEYMSNEIELLVGLKFFGGVKIELNRVFKKNKLIEELEKSYADYFSFWQKFRGIAVKNKDIKYNKKKINENIKNSDEYKNITKILDNLTKNLNKIRLY